MMLELQMKVDITYVGWFWKENPTAGFDIVLHNVNSTGSDFTISHGLGVTPEVIFAKNRDSSHIGCFSSKNW